MTESARNRCVPARMTAAWWWIDRWRKSTAYTDMTAEEQGIYRNLLDEVWLRTDHTIPNDPRILAKISGDPEAWARCGPKVLRWMLQTEAGWTNETALQVINQSNRRAEKQQHYRDRLRNESGNATGNGAGNKPGSPSPSPSLKKDLDVLKVGIDPNKILITSNSANGNGHSGGSGATSADQHAFNERVRQGMYPSAYVGKKHGIPRQKRIR